MEILKIEGTPQEFKEFLTTQKPLFVSDIDLKSLNGAWKDYIKPEEEKMFQELFGSETSTNETSKDNFEELEIAQKKIAELEKKLAAIKNAFEV